MFVIALPIVAFLGTESESFSSLWFGAGLLIAFLGLSIEAIADFQKSQFKKHDKTAVMQSGL